MAMYVGPHPQLPDEELRLRKLLWFRHGCDGASLYGDDGEMSCNACMIDFRRGTAQEIEDRLTLLGLQKLHANGGCKRCGIPTFGPICASCKGEKPPARSGTGGRT